MSQNIIRELEKAQLKKNPIDFKVGDTVRVKVLIREGNKERTQSFEGMVIAIKGGGINQTFTVRRVFQGVGIERTFVLNSPKVVEVKAIRKGKASRAKLYYMRNRVGTKAIRLREDTARIASDLAAKASAKDQAKAEAAEETTDASEE